MDSLKTKQNWAYYSIAKGIATSIVVLPVMIYTIIVFVHFVIGKTEGFVLEINIIVILSIVGASFAGILLIVDEFVKKHFRHRLVYESLEIINFTQTPKILPKVVYVYTCHNDMMEERLLQNSQQTYKNFEVWISDGSEKEEVRKQIRAIAAKHNFKLYQLGGKGSENKAANLNAFLKKSGATFDYLLIGDADVVLKNTSVSEAVLCFNSKKFKHLGFVSFLYYYYNTGTLFTDVFRFSENQKVYKSGLNFCFQQNQYPELFGSCCLISKDLLLDNNNQFPSGCLEDQYFDHFALKNGWNGFVLPTSSCVQAFDKNIKSYAKRNGRIHDWTIRMCKHRIFDQYNEKYKLWYMRMLAQVLTGFTAFIGFVFAPLIVSVIITYWSYFIGNALLLTMISSSLILLFIRCVCSFLDTCQVSTRNKYFLISSLAFWVLKLAYMPYVLKHWFCSTFLSKYASFGGSLHGNKATTSKQQNWKNIKWELILFLICSITLAVFVTLFLYFGLVTNNNLWLLFAFILVTFVFGAFSLSFLLVVVLYLISFVKLKNKYDPKEFIYLDSFHDFPKIKNKFYKDHPELKGGSNE